MNEYDFLRDCGFTEEEIASISDTPKKPGYFDYEKLLKEREELIERLMPSDTDDRKSD